MKRFLLLLSCIGVMLLAGMPCASANSSGLADDIAVMPSPDHNALVVTYLRPSPSRRVYTKAVYQPEDKRDDAVNLTRTETGFTLSYGEAERYTFFALAESYELKEAVIGAFHMSAIVREADGTGYIAGYEASDGQGTAVFQGRVFLGDFNIELFPRSVDEVRHLNLMRASLDSGRDCLGWWGDAEEPGIPHHGIGTGTEPVYSSPFGASSWRAANGKAAVALSGQLWGLGNYRHADGEVYACIRYDISERTQRIGYIRAEVIDGKSARDGEPTDNFLNVPVRATRDTYLTDDPDVSQYPQFSVLEDTRFVCMGMHGNDYAYVAAEVRSGRFVDGGEIIWGFVPLKALALDESDTFRSERQADVMQRMAGEWVFYAGGNMAEDEFTFGADGIYTGRYCDWNTGEVFQETHGIWYVAKYNPNWNLYWNDPPYEIHLIRNDGTVTVKGLTMHEKGFSLTNWEGGGGYMRPEEATGENE